MVTQLQDKPETEQLRAELGERFDDYHEQSVAQIEHARLQAAANERLREQQIQERPVERP